MIGELENLFHPRIRQTCGRLFLDGHFQPAVQEAFRQVELAVRERAGLDRIGVRLVRHAFGGESGPRLVTPFGPESQEAARAYFEGAFTHYRNQAAHGEGGFDEGRCARCLIIASDLLDLAEASAIAFSSEQDLCEMARRRGFPDVKSVQQLLEFLGGYTVLDEVVDGLFEEMAERGWGESELQFVFEAGLMEFVTTPISNPDINDPFCAEKLGVFTITPRGQNVIKGLFSA